MVVVVVLDAIAQVHVLAQMQVVQIEITVQVLLEAYLLSPPNRVQGTRDGLSETRFPPRDCYTCSVFRTALATK